MKVMYEVFIEYYTSPKMIEFIFSEITYLE